MSNSKYKNSPSWLSKNSIIIFCISILVFSGSYIYSIAKLNNNISNGINYTIKIDENFLNKNKSLTAKDIDSFEKSIQSALEKSSSELVLENANNTINSVGITITVSSIFFTVLVVIMSLFQFMQAKDYEKKYEEYTNKIDSLEKNFQNKLYEHFNELDEKTNELSSTIIDYNKIIFSYNNAHLLFESANYISALENLKETVSSIKSFLDKKNDYINNTILSHLKKINIASHDLIMIICLEYDFGLFDSDLALESLNSLIDAEPDNYNNYFNIGPTSIKLIFGNSITKEKALFYYLNALDKAISKDNEPDIAICRYNLALFHSNWNDHFDAIDNYDKAIRLDPHNDQYYFSRAQQYEKHINYDAALDDYTKAIEINDDNDEYFSHRANLYKKMNKHIEAIDDYTKAIEINNNNDGYFSHRAELYKKIDKQLEALDDYTKCISLNGVLNSKYYLERAELYEKLDNPNLALFDYNTAMSIDPNNYECYYKFAKIYEKQNKFDLASNYYLKSIETIHYSSTMCFRLCANVYFDFASFYIKQKKFDSALEIFNKIDNKFGKPDDFKYYSILALIFENKNNFEKALANYKKSLKFVKSDKNCNVKFESKKLVSKINYCKSKLK